MERQAEGPLSFYQRFLRITFRAYFPLFLRARARARALTRTHSHTYTHIRINIHRNTPAFSFLSIVPLVSIDHLSCPILLRALHGHSPFASPRSFAFVHLDISDCTYMYVYMYVCTSVYVYALRLNRRTRFHVARL